ncbi:MAG TPA: chemotaxis protein CheW [Candidatus Acidoferrum sp.]|nr:chemotaxis protein CheW [Candidatus Acidoferrum sp.]
MNNLVRMEQKAAKPAAVDEAEGQYLTFLLAREMFAISISSIKEIIEYGQITPVPMVPGFVRGVINLRGQVVPVIDLQVRLGRDSSPVGKRTCIVIFEVTLPGDGRREVMGVVVDSVLEVLGIAASQIERAPQFGANLRQDFIAGLGKIADKFVVILNVEKVLSIEELASMVQLTGNDVAA